jgi:hypothetical protein
MNCYGFTNIGALSNNFKLFVTKYKLKKFDNQVLHELLNSGIS